MRVRAVTAMLAAMAVALVPAAAASPAPAPPETAASAAAGASGSPATHALLLNGGDSPPDNALSHLHHLQDMVAELQRRGIPAERIHVFSADGEDPADDLAVRREPHPDFWLVERTEPGRALHRTELADTQWDTVELRPARLAELRRWFDGAGRRLRAGDTLLVFVTDHGTRDSEDPGGGFISLWGESMSVLEFRALLAHLRPGVRAVSVMSQCYSGAFAEAMFPLAGGRPTGDVCGFYSAPRDRPAYGCYPEGRDRDRIGHAFRFIAAMGRHDSLDRAHLEALASDTTPDVPLRTSDLYLQRLLAGEAARRGRPLDELADELLRQAWTARARWEPEIRLLDRLGELYGTFSPRSLAELETQLDELEALDDELSTYRQRWLLALDELRREQLAVFLDDREAWRQRLQPAALDGLEPDARRRTLDELVGAVRAFAGGRQEVLERLVRLRDRHQDAETAQYRVQVRLAALERLRAVLLRVAALEMLGGGTFGEAAGAEAPQALEALERLRACERATPGSPPPRSGQRAAAVELEPLPPIEEDLEIVARVLPSWLGITFRPASDAQREALGVGRGAAVVQQVYQDSPAAEAGLLPGDVVTGPPGEPFGEPRQIREWVMGAPREVPLRLELLREAERQEVAISLTSFPLEQQELVGPPGPGDPAPGLSGLSWVVPASSPPEALAGGPYMLFFWATWCDPCKQAVPELLAWSADSGVPVVAISDEESGELTGFLEDRDDAFPEIVASDRLRGLHLGYRVSGTPTFVLVDADGRIAWRQTGYHRTRRPLSVGARARPEAD